VIISFLTWSNRNLIFFKMRKEYMHHKSTIIMFLSCSHASIHLNFIIMHTTGVNVSSSINFDTLFFFLYNNWQGSLVEEKKTSHCEIIECDVILNRSFSSWKMSTYQLFLMGKRQAHNDHYKRKNVETINFSFVKRPH
jgi:hypothetical protein